MTDLRLTASDLSAPGKGILAADESTSTMNGRLQKLNIPATEESRRRYRALLFETPAMEEIVSGVIMYRETLTQLSSDGTPFPQLLAKKHVLPGIKVDTGAEPLPGFPGEKVTGGLDGLVKRLADYAKLGCRFAKWRAVITIGPHMPSIACVDANASALARYAALCQEAGLVPIVEPEVLMNGDHSIDCCEDVTARVLESVFNQLRRHRVALDGILLKPNMVLPGEDCPKQSTPVEVAEATLRCLSNIVPPQVPGIVFLSGGQSAELATEHLQVMNSQGTHPWQLSFSYGRALQTEALEIWAGQPANVTAAQDAFKRRLRLVAAARDGRYSADMEAAA